MPIMRCPHCAEYLHFNDNEPDIQHACNSGKAALDQEDFINMGDSSGLLRGDAGLLRGANYEGNRKTIAVTARGNNAQIFSQRQHYEHIDLI